MICTKCGAELENNAIVCSKCGNEIQQDKIVDREGREPKKEKISESIDRVDINYLDRNIKYLEDTQTHSTMPDPETTIQIKKLEYDEKSLRKLSRNWYLYSAIIAIMVLSIFIGINLYFKKTDNGQIILARKFKADSAGAYWIVGEEFMNKGDIVSAIRAFSLADSKDPANADGLLSLANAYEAINYNTQAEAIYRRIINNISPNRPESYRSLVRMLTAQNRMSEVADTLRLAIDNTGIESFKDQLYEMLPLSPTLSLPGGRYNSEKTVTINSPQGYEIYYLMDDGSGDVLKDGILYDGNPIKIPEGAIKLTAVCKSLELYSEPTEAKYILIYPSPAAPKFSLASGTYSKLATLSIRNADEKEKDLVIHYTIDGSVPTENSPIYDGEPIKLPSGRVTVKAFSVNSIGKASNNQIVDYKFNVSPYPLKMYGDEDVFSGIKLGATTQNEFIKQFDKSNDYVESKYGINNNPSRIYKYNWGTVEFVLLGNKWVTAKLVMNSKLTEAPRDAGFGKTEEEIVALFKDMGQKPNLDNTRGLYYSTPNIAAIEKDDDGKRVIRYTCGTKDGLKWVLEYYIGENKMVEKIVHYYQ